MKLRKINYLIVITLSLLALTSCGEKKKASQPTLIDGKYALEEFSDVIYPSTLNLEELKDLPTIVDLKSNMTSVKDQAEGSSCSFFAAIGLVEFAIKKKTNVEVNLSEEYLLNATKTNGINSDTDAGDTLSNLYQAIYFKSGFLLERDWPYQPVWFDEKKECKIYSSADAKAPKECFSHNSPPENILKRKIPGDDFLAAKLEISSTNNLFHLLSENKNALYISLPVHPKGWVFVEDDTKGQMQYTEEMRQECIRDRNLCGLHAVILTGYDIDKKVFFFKNSWSESWGNKGYGEIPFNVVDRYVSRIYASVELMEDIELPDDIESEKSTHTSISSSSMKASLKESEKNLEITYEASLHNVGLNPLKIEVILVKKNEATPDLPNDNNTSAVILSSEDQAKYNRSKILNYIMLFQDTKANDLVWTEESPGKIELTKRLFESETFKKIKSSDIGLFARTTIYHYTDSGTKVLSRVYSPIK